MIKLTFFSSLLFLLAFAQNPNLTANAQISGFAPTINEVSPLAEDSKIGDAKWYFATSTCIYQDSKYCDFSGDKVATVGVQEKGEPTALREIFKHNVSTRKCYQTCANNINMHGPYDDHGQASKAQHAYCYKMEEKGYRVIHETLAYRY